jgi:hypothetical protein
MNTKNEVPVEHQIIHLFDDTALISSIDFVMYDKIVQEITVEFVTNELF